MRASDSFTSSGNNNTFTGGAGTDTFTATGNDNTFNVGTGSDTMSDSGTGNAISFQAVQTGSGTGLDVNVSGTPVNGDVGNDTAVLGSGLATYNFVSGAAGFTSFTGAGSGDTTFTAAPSTGGYSFTGTGLANTADFSANRCGVTANIAHRRGQPHQRYQLRFQHRDGHHRWHHDRHRCAGRRQRLRRRSAGEHLHLRRAANTLSYGGYTTSGLCFNLTGTAAIPTLPASTGDRVGLGASCSTPAADYFNVPAGSLDRRGVAEATTSSRSALPRWPSRAVAGTTPSISLDTGTVVRHDRRHRRPRPGLITSPTINGVTFTPGCGAAADLCVSSIKGSSFNDTYIVNSAILGGRCRPWPSPARRGQ